MDAFVFHLFSILFIKSYSKTTIINSLTTVLAKIGPTFVKVGQLLSNRPDLIKDSDLLEGLKSLQDQVLKFDDNQALEILQNEIKSHWNKQISDIFSELEENAVASASLGQVYRGVLRENGKLVAIKIQRPDISLDASIDLMILRVLAVGIKKQLKLRSDLVAIIDEFGMKLFDELNYVKEARNCARFKQLYGELDGVYVPDVYQNLTTKKILVMEFVNGTKAPWGDDSVRMTKIGVECSLKQLLEGGFYNLDPHSGNLLRTDDGRLAYLDFGMMGELEQQKRYEIIASIAHLINREYSLLVTDFIKLGFLPDDFGDTEMLVPILQDAFQSATPDGKLSKLSFSALSRNISGIARKAPIRLPPYYSLIIRSLVILEGIALSSDPNFKIIDQAYPYVTNRLLNDQSPELLEALKDVILDRNSGRIRWSRLESLLIDEKPKLPKKEISQSAQNALSNEFLSKAITFFLSANGRFLRDALILDLVDTIDNVGLGTVEYLHNQSFGLIPEPIDHADTRSLKNLQTVLKNAFTTGFQIQPRRQTRARFQDNRALKILSQIGSTPQREELTMAAWRVIGELSDRNSKRFWRLVRYRVLKKSA
eukprot:CAMPEP_0182451634 /NCGR_PEP_ID=MMETSP1172-20130603/43824_1 /TAXON_ID=708627 /ORGANISM="Timspurckia oligopyrenoides, Strain CCMP3278" /LENGTH=595 /DNA_ID=CAMNT_0024649417 /DNA_START=319 /DNA_END=2107 /DNA_ORIENTATION=-